jgi:hypothetical protein
MHKGANTINPCSHPDHSRNILTDRYGKIVSSSGAILTEISLNKSPATLSLLRTLIPPVVQINSREVFSENHDEIVRALMFLQSRK